MPGHARLHGDRAQAVRNDVVHFPGQPQSFFRPGELDRLGGTAARLQLKPLPVAAGEPRHVPGYPGRDDQEQLNRVLILVRVQRDRGGKRGPGGDRRPDGGRQRPMPRPPVRRREDRDGQVRTGVADKRGERHADQGGRDVDPGHRRYHGDWPAAPDYQRRRGHRAERCYRVPRVPGQPGTEQDRHGEGNEAARGDRPVDGVGNPPFAVPASQLPADPRSAAGQPWRREGAGHGRCIRCHHDTDPNRRLTCPGSVARRTTASFSGLRHRQASALRPG